MTEKSATILIIDDPYRPEEPDHKKMTYLYEETFKRPLESHNHGLSVGSTATMVRHGNWFTRLLNRLALRKPTIEYTITRIHPHHASFTFEASDK